MVHHRTVVGPVTPESVRHADQCGATSSQPIVVRSTAGRSAAIAWSTLALPGGQKATAPLGVPSPVGPSQPVVALHSALPHDPLLPLITSLSAEAWLYGKVP